MESGGQYVPRLYFRYRIGRYCYSFSLVAADTVLRAVSFTSMVSVRELIVTVSQVEFRAMKASCSSHLTTSSTINLKSHSSKTCITTTTTSLDHEKTESYG